MCVWCVSVAWSSCVRVLWSSHTVLVIIKVMFHFRTLIWLLVWFNSGFVVILQIRLTHNLSIARHVI